MVDALIKPLHFGDRLDRRGNYALLVSPGQFTASTDVSFSTGIPAVAVLGKGNRLCRLRIEDKRFLIFSLSMTSTYKEIKARFPAAKDYWYGGYGIEVVIKDNVIFGFSPEGEHPREDQRPSWIDLLPETHSDHCAYT